MTDKKSTTQRIKKKIFESVRKYVRPHLPTKLRVYNTVKVKGRYLDTFFGFQAKTERRQHYEYGCVRSIHENIQEDDKVVIIGGGMGITPVIAARESRKKVVVFEGSDFYSKETLRTAELNDVKNIKVQTKIVGNPISVWAEQTSEFLSPKDLPECDMLQLDCEGSEISILKEITISPRVIIVETHGHLGAPSSKVEQILEEKGYTITSKYVAELDNRFINDDIFVITGKKSVN